MAVQLLLAKRDDMLADVDTLNLLSYTAGFHVEHDGWIPNAPGPGDITLPESILLRVSGSSHDNLAANLQGLSEKALQVERSKDSVEAYNVWLRAQLTNETNPRQAFIHKMRHKPKTSLYGRLTNAGNKIQEYVLELERMPYWEAVTVATQTFSNKNLIGSTGSYTTVLGDVPARLANVKLTGSTQQDKYWLGIRSTRFGDPAQFKPVWSLAGEAYAFYNNTTGGTSNPDDTTYSNYKVVTTFATVTSMAERVRADYGHAGADVANHRGRYLVLLRAKTTSSLVCRVQMASGYLFSLHDRVEISNIDWKYYELGEIEVPGVKILGGTAPSVYNYNVGIYAEKVSGSGNLDIDCYVFIPVNEGFVYVEGGISGNEIHVQHRPNGTIDNAIMATSGFRVTNVGTSRIVGGLVPGTGIVVFAGQEPTAQVKADTVTAVVNYYPRWETLRGAE